MHLQQMKLFLKIFITKSQTERRCSVYLSVQERAKFALLKRNSMLGETI